MNSHHLVDSDIDRHGHATDENIYQAMQQFFSFFSFSILFIVLEEICPKLHIGYNLGRRGEGVTSR